MKENQQDNINHQSVDNRLLNAGQVEISLINKILLDKGELFVEHKFFNIVQTIASTTKTNISPTELYAQIFPNLTPTRKGIEKVFENAINSKEFKPLYHSSEYLYKQWLINFNNCVLVNSVDTIIKIDAQSCKKTLEDFKLWVLDLPTIKGSFIRSNIKWDLGTLPFGVPTKYIPKNSTVKKDILDQLAKNGTMQLVSIDDIKNKIEISLENSDIILTRKSRYPITPKIIQSWLKNFGVTISLVTSTYLLEFGMPYGGSNVSLDEILRYTNNGYGIIGLLAFQLAFLINMDDSNNIIEFRHHPLSQSIVLGLARLEYYLNPKIACL